MGAASGADIRRDAYLDRNLAFGEDCHQFRVVYGGKAVADAFGSDIDCAPDALGSSRFAGVRREPQARIARLGVELAENFGSRLPFVASDPDADDGGMFRAHLRGFSERRALRPRPRSVGRRRRSSSR